MTEAGTKKILWVEDDDFLIGLIAKRLMKESFVVLHADKGEDALELAKKELPDVILLDLLLPGMSGIEILRALKAEPATKDIPVLIFSNLGDISNKDEAHALGAAGFFVKALVTLDEILAEIHKVV